MDSRVSVYVHIPVAQSGFGRQEQLREDVYVGGGLPTLKPVSAKVERRIRQLGRKVGTRLGNWGQLLRCSAG